MSLAPHEIDKIAKLACLRLQPEELTTLQGDLSAILDMVACMQTLDTQGIQPMAHPLEMAQRLRADQVTEQNARTTYQTIAPQVDAGLYIVPKVIG